MLELKKLLTIITCSVATAVSQADILSFDATKVHQVLKPQNQRYGPNAYNLPMVEVWNERTGVTLPANLPVDIAKPGAYYGKNELGNFWINAGTRIDSAMIYFDPPKGEIVETTITFSGRVLGVIIESDRADGDRLLNSDALALPNVPRRNFPRGHFNMRGMDLPPSRVIVQKGHADCIAVAGNTVTIRLGATNPGDQIRVITQSSH